MDVNQVLSLLDAEDSDSVHSFSSECLDLLEPLEEKEESEDEDMPKSKVFPKKAHFSDSYSWVSQHLDMNNVSRWSSESFLML